MLILILYFAYAGQAWNIMMGFAGQLSLGHAIYVGLGAYTAAALYVHFGVAPWIGLLVAVPVAMACGAMIGFLAFRFGVAGVYFVILTIVFAEFARIAYVTEPSTKKKNAIAELHQTKRIVQPRNRTFSLAGGKPRIDEDVDLGGSESDGSGPHQQKNPSHSWMP